MDVDKLAIDLLLKGMTQEQQTAALESIKDSVTQAKTIQKQRIGENVNVVIQALRKMEADLRGEYSDVADKLSERITSIKDGQDGRNGSDGRAGKDGRPGRDGLAGAKGADGLPGADGIDGVDGVSVTDASIDFDGSLIISLSNGRVINVGEVVSQDLADKIQVISTMSTNGAVGIQDEGTTISSGVKNINFVGAAVTSTASGDDVTVNVSAGTGTVTSVAVSGGTTGLTTSGGPITTTGTITLAGTLAVANGGTGVTTSTGTTNVVLSNSPTLVSPALGTPASGVVTNLTGTASININGTVGATTPATGAFTTLSTGNGASGDVFTLAGAGTINNGGSSLTIYSSSGNTLKLGTNGSLTNGILINTAGAVSFPAGTVALPSITTSGDTNTGIYFPAADTVGITTGGVQRGAFSSTGLSSAYSILSSGTATQVGVTQSTYGGSYSTTALGYPETHIRPNAGYSGSISFTENAVGDRWSIGIKPGDSNLYFFNVRNITAATGILAINSSGAVIHPAGTAALPSITTSGDTNTGVYFPAADTIAFTEGGAEAMRINSSGIVLVGTASATGTNLLQVNSDIRVNGFTLGKGASSVATNTGFGSNVFSAITTGSQNTAFGYAALSTDTTGFGNAAFGLSALQNNNGGSYNTALGHSTLYYNTTGTQNTAVGHACMGSGHTTGAFNTGVGYTALQSCTTGVATLGAITGGTGYTDGTYPGVVMTLSSGSAAATYPTATIVVAGGVVTTVTITSAGFRFVNTTTVLTAPAASIGGTGSGFSVPVATLNAGNSNTGVGHQAILFTTVGDSNTAVGYQAGRQNTTGSGNTSFGSVAGYAGVTASNNTSIGYLALRLATGGSNVGLGYNSGGAITTGTGNVVIGGYTGSTAPISTTGSNSIVFSDGAANVRQYYDGTNSAWVWKTGASERMRIDSSGNVGIGTATPNASAILDAQSTTKGVRMPNMTTTQKNAIATPAAGLMVYDTTLAKLCVYTTAWETITSA